MRAFRRIHTSRIKTADYNLFHKILTDDFGRSEERAMFPRQRLVKSFGNRNPVAHLVRVLEKLSKEPTVDDIHEASLKGEWPKVWAFIKVRSSREAC